jgi:uncharacterized protein (DUF362 family)
MARIIAQVKPALTALTALATLTALGCTPSGGGGGDSSDAAADAATGIGTVSASGTAAGTGSATAAVSATATATAAVSAAMTAAAAASTDVVASASAAQYESGPSVIASDSINGDALRKRHALRIRNDRSPVTILRGESPLELGKRICEAVVPKRGPETPVLLKPNLCGFDSVKDPEKHKGDDGVKGRTTDPAFVRGVVQCLKARGHTKITIAEGCGHSHKFWQDLVKLTGYEAMAAEEGVALVAMDDDGVFDVQGDKPGKPLAVKGIERSSVPTLLIPKVLAEHLDRGLFLSLPKVKTHRYSVVSVAVKGMQGTVMLSDKAPAYKQKWRMHRELRDYLDGRKAGKDDRYQYVTSLRTFAERMVDVLEVSAPDAVLAEGAPAMGGDGFQLMVPSAEKVAIGGTNPVRVDRVAAEFLGLWNSAALASELGGHRTSPLIEAAAKRFKVDLKETSISGDVADLLSAPRPVHYKAMAPFRLDWDPGKPPLPVGPIKGAAPSPAPAGDAPAPAGTGAADAGAGKSAPAPESSSGKPEAHAASLGKDTITIDGKATDAAWSRAKVVQWDTDYAGKPDGIPTRARFIWSKAGLHALFELSNTGLNTDKSKPVNEERKGLYNEDCIEIFLTPDPAAPKRYFEIEIGPFGHFFDIGIDREAKKEDIAWSSGAKIATTTDADAHRAVIEVLLTAPGIRAVMAPGARLPMNLYRMEGKNPRHYLAWSPPRTAKPNFHVPEAFGALVLDP